MSFKPINFDPTLLKTEQDFEWYLLTNIKPITHDFPDVIDLNGEFYTNIFYFVKDKRDYTIFRSFNSGKILLKISEIIFSYHDSFSDFLKDTARFLKNKNQ